MNNGGSEMRKIEFLTDQTKWKQICEKKNFHKTQTQKKIDVKSFERTLTFLI